MQTHSDELNWDRRRTFHELNSLSLVHLMKSSTFEPGLSLHCTFKGRQLIESAYLGSVYVAGKMHSQVKPVLIPSGWFRIFFLSAQT